MTGNNHAEVIKEAYSLTKVSESYIEERFSSSIGRVLHEAQVRFVVEAIRALQITKVLEVAPGPARLTVDVARSCKDTCGTVVDVNVNMLDEAQKRLAAAGVSDRWRTERGDAFSLPCQDAFQLAYTFRFIRHFHKSDRAKIYNQIHQHLLPEGYLIFDAINRKVSEPLRSSLEEYPIYDELYDFPELSKELEENGFRIIKTAQVQRCYNLLNAVQVLIGPRSQKLAYVLMRLIQMSQLGSPLEWIVLCQKA